MSAQVFYVGSQDKYQKRNGYIPSRFYTINGQPVVDPILGGSQDAYIYPDASDRYRTSGKVANPNNYLIVPEKFTEQHARDYANSISNTQRIPAIGTQLGRVRIGLDFRPGGSQDLQRDPQWGIPPDPSFRHTSAVPPIILVS